MTVIHADTTVNGVHPPLERSSARARKGVQWRDPIHCSADNATTTTHGRSATLDGIQPPILFATGQLKPINSGCKISGDVTHSRTHKPLRRSGLLIREPQSCLHRTYGLQHTAMKCAPQALPLLIRRAPYSPNGQTWAAQRERENHGQRQKCRKPLSAAHINHPSLPRPSHTSPRKVRKRLGLARQS
jgi:hypothetical protein